MTRGKFIVLEGIDGCGKDTQANFLKTEFPGAVFVQVLDIEKPKTKKLREVIFNKDYKYENKAEVFLFYADKVEMMAEIKKALEAGKNVFCNRWELSQYAYQIYGKQQEDLRALTDYLTEDLQKEGKPDFYILYDISVEESARRRAQRAADTSSAATENNYYDDKKKDFFEKVIIGYKTEIQKFNHVIINGEQTKEKVFADTMEALKNII